MRSGPWRYRSAPPVTVAMVTFNSARFVADAIRSVLAQDFEDFELLVCDDCSRDETWEIVASFDDRRIRAVRNEVNAGEYRNRNHALALARGRYLTYIDGDDLMYSHGLRVMLRSMERFPDAGFGGCLPPSEKFIFPVALTPKQYCSCTFLGPMVLASNFTQLIFRTEALRSIGGFDLRYRTGDLHIQYALGIRHDVVLLGGGLAWWRRHSGQASEALIANGEALVELWRYGRAFVDDPACPLDGEEKKLARANLSRMLLRNSVKMLFHRHPADAWRMVFESGMPWTDWPCLLSRYDKPYLQSVTGANPLRSPDAQPPPRARVAGAIRQRPTLRAGPPLPAARSSARTLPALELAE